MLQAEHQHQWIGRVQCMHTQQFHQLFSNIGNIARPVVSQTADFWQLCCRKDISVSRLEECSVCTGSGVKAGTTATTCSTCGGQGQVVTVQRTPIGAFQQVAAACCVFFPPNMEEQHSPTCIPLSRGTYKAVLIFLTKACQRFLWTFSMLSLSIFYST